MKIIELLKDVNQRAIIGGIKTQLYYDDGDTSTWRVLSKAKGFATELYYCGPSEEKAVEAFIKNESN